MNEELKECKANVVELIEGAVDQAISDTIVTAANLLDEEGHPEAAAIIRSLLD